jgi:hypothetical protein
MISNRAWSRSSLTLNLEVQENSRKSGASWTGHPSWGKRKGQGGSHALAADFNPRQMTVMSRLHGRSMLSVVSLAFGEADGPRKGRSPPCSMTNIT